MDGGVMDINDPDFADNVLSIFDHEGGPIPSPSSNWLGSAVATDNFGLDDFDTDLNLCDTNHWKRTDDLEELYQQVLGPLSAAGSDTSSDHQLSSGHPSSSPGMSLGGGSSGSESEFDLSDSGFDSSPLPCMDALSVPVPAPSLATTVLNVPSLVSPQVAPTSTRIQLPSNAQVIRIPINTGSGPIPIVMKREAVKRPRLCILRGENGKVQTAKVVSLSGLSAEQIKALKSGNVKTVSVSSLSSLVKSSSSVVGQSGLVTLSPAAHRVELKKSEPVQQRDDSEDDEEFDEDEKPELQKSEGDGEEYPPLILTDEERKIMIREKITLPDRYPLSREEERNLRRIRRKIRNKRSAQDSRQRKKQYVDDLEKRVKLCAVEKAALQEKVKRLESENASLLSQLRGLQSTMSGLAGKAAPTSTAFLIVVMSVALLLAPSVRNSSKIELEEVMEGQENGVRESLREFDDGKVVAPRRTLLADMSEVDAVAAVNNEIKAGERFLNAFSGKRKYSWMDIPVSDGEDDDDSAVVDDGGGDAGRPKRAKMAVDFDLDGLKTTEFAKMATDSRVVNVNGTAGSATHSSYLAGRVVEVDRKPANRF